MDISKRYGCPICGSWNGMDVGKINDFGHNPGESFLYRNCIKCGSIYLVDLPSRDDFIRYYPDTYQPYNASYDRITEAFIARRLRREISLFNKYVDRTKQIQLLEIGCATGEYIKSIRDIAGYVVTGVELGEKAAEWGRKNNDLDIRNCELIEARFPSRSFDIVVMSHLVEHVLNPVQLVAEIKRILKPNGIVYIKTPRVDTIERSIFGKYWLPYEAPRHMQIFSSFALLDFLVRYGFRIEERWTELIPNDAIISTKYYAIGNKLSIRIIDWFSLNNVLALAIFTLWAIILKLFSQGGRMAVIARNSQ